MKFKIIVASDDNSDVDYSVGYLSAVDAKRFIDGWQRLQDEAIQQSAQRTIGTVCDICEKPVDPKTGRCLDCYPF
jgi:hypothetical protein